MEGLARVFLIGGASKAVRYDEQTTIERVIHVVARGIGISQVAVAHFALRLVTGPSPQTAGSGDSLWLHPMLRITQLPHIYARHLPIGVCDEIKLEMRMRFMPQSVYELQATDSSAFVYLHEQVVDEFFSHVAWRSSVEVALEVAALKVCRDFAEHQHNKGADHHLEDLDIEACIQSLIPNVLHNPGFKHSHLKKTFTAYIKKFSATSPNESIIRSLALLLEVVKFDVELFKASLGAGWTKPVELVVGPHTGLSYRLNERCDSSRLLELRTIAEITIRKMENGSEKTLMQLNLSGAAKPVLITLSTEELSQSLAHLLDGYQMLYNQRDSVFKLKGIERCETLTMHEATIRPKTPNNIDSNIRLRRELITLKELIGGGQFGNVYKAVYHDLEKDERIAVAVKVCKTDAEPADTQLILQESSLMRNFRHSNIIQLIGVCVDQPMWLVLELAPKGELREYLQQEKDWLPLRILTLFCSQICDSLVYLHSTRFVHRDIAARNILVCSPQCVKLADFGLSRALDYDAVYTASRGKLPIKWLAPESVNYRQFSMASDVWMFGVCMWEIFSLGVKPWAGVTNSDVIMHIEQGSRPPCPEKCPTALYNFIRSKMWAIEPHKRPTVDQIYAIIEDVRQQIIQNIPPEQIIVGKPMTAAGVIVAEMSSLPGLTLYRTMEDQKRQAEEDAKWLEQEDDEDEDDQDIDQIPSTSHSSVENIRTSNGYLHHTPTSTRSLRFEDKTSRGLRRSVDGVCDAVTKLQNSFNNLTHNDDFLHSVKEVTSQLREMLIVASGMRDRVTTTTQRTDVDMTKTLIANDMKQMSRVMGKLQVNGHQATYNTLRRDVVRICGELAVNCTTLQLQLTQPPLENEFSSLLSNC
ncbi:Inactive tyrosine-protein kinase kin-32 [Caenorhabditis elegans]|uniref:Inactive tyrosine-protein kinase kin-32 n=2 Tax=Caenorhabditis elegans TaxID=6239 RepID=KIN32_CAEEL|nr:Inactive tyrosine-protein kinase kin-32 [Caenorhabditis elegans]Q95YD4.1 RecName: Full=Inactive tyrosine-protein kinase kin-32 [Caenorhabditis elegans]CCD66186.1 Inactive tyrosine-protein kinase kin-32 [Caenorhabditis elegans]|eukprot:NP_740841.1 Inactive tyrosine-protein kinase kin-32 [Caenorhabditis elegans]